MHASGRGDEDNRPSRFNDPETESDLVYELRERIRQLEAALGQEWFPPRALSLTKIERQVLGVLISRPVSCSYAAIYDVLYGARPTPPEIQIVHVFVSKIRRKLRPFNVSIGTTWGSGYFITPENLARLEALYDEGERA